MFRLAEAAAAQQLPGRLELVFATGYLGQLTAIECYGTFLPSARLLSSLSRLAPLPP